MIVKARFTLSYSLIVLGVSGALIAWAWWLLGSGAGWELKVGVLTITENAIKLVLLSLLIVSVLLTQIRDLIQPQDILVITLQGIHDRRLTRGPVLWSQIAQLHVYRKGWQQMVLIVPVNLTTPPVDMALGSMPLYAFNRLCARWLKRPELTVGLGGLTVSTQDLLVAIQAHYRGPLTSE